MIFSSYKFIFLFFPVAFIGFLFLYRTGRSQWTKAWLVAASLAFYSVGQPDFLAGFAGTLVFNYLIIRGLHRFQKDWLRLFLLVLSCVENLGLLAYYKYYNFFFENVNRFLGTDFSMLQVILPIGISFFTFQILALVVSCWRNECETPGFLNYLVFATFFPQLIVGPVVKHEELLPQIQNCTFLKRQPEDLYRGTMLFSFGCAKKILLADPMIDFAAAFYSGDVGAASVPEAWTGVLCYTMAYYFDFSGYIDMARGLGHLFGFHLPVNFDSPYRAKDFGDFWRRWNITISRFFQETIFDNLFGFGDRMPKLILATVLTFLVSGLWHGAGWHYIVWGLVNGILVCIANIRMLRMRRPLPSWLAVLMTFLTGAVVRVLFDCQNLPQALSVYKKMFVIKEILDFHTMLETCLEFSQEHIFLCLLLMGSILLCFFAPNTNLISDRTEFKARDAVFSAVLLAVSLFFMSHVSQFLYFNF